MHPQIGHLAANRRFQFNKRRQLFVRTHNETFSVVAMCISNPHSRLLTRRPARHRNRYFAVEWGGCLRFYKTRCLAQNESVGRRQKNEEKHLRINVIAIGIG
jgi:hypothetical protein